MLVPCRACARHVRDAETTCPFCGAAIEATAPRELAPLPNDRKLTRAALTFATAAAIATTACGKSAVGESPPPQPTPTDVPAPAYGPPPMDPTTTPVAVDAGNTAPQTSASPPNEPPQHAPVPLYGVPPVNRK